MVDGAVVDGAVVAVTAAALPVAELAEAAVITVEPTEASAVGDVAGGATTGAGSATVGRSPDVSAKAMPPITTLPAAPPSATFQSSFLVRFIVFSSLGGDRSSPSGPLSRAGMGRS